MTKQAKNRTKKLLCVVLLATFFVVVLHTQTAHAASLGNMDISENLRTSVPLKTLWKTFMNVVNGLVIVILIVVAFAEMLRINVNTYGLKKILPTIVFAVIAANFSYILCQAIIGASNVMLTFFTSPNNELTGAWRNMLGASYTGDANASGTGTQGGTLPTSIPNSTSIASFGTTSSPIGWLIRAIYYILAAILMLLLTILFLARVWMIYLLVVLAPIGFMAMVLPQTKSIFNKWWSNFIKWAFLPIPSVLFIWLGAKFVSFFSGGQLPIFASVLGLGCLFLAITTPFKLGGGVLGSWGNFAQAQLGNWAVRARTAASVLPDGSRKRWLNRSAQVLGAVNPQTYIRGMKNRLSASEAARDKTITKSWTYGQVAGARQRFIEGSDSIKDDLQNAESSIVGAHWGRAAAQIRGFNTPAVQEMIRRANNANAVQDYLDANQGTTWEDARDILLAEHIKNMNKDDLLETFRGTELNAKGAGKHQQRAVIFSSRRGERERFARDNGLETGRTNPFQGADPDMISPVFEAEEEGLKEAQQHLGANLSRSETAAILSLMPSGDDSAPGAVIDGDVAKVRDHIEHVAGDQIKSILASIDDRITASMHLLGDFDLQSNIPEEAKARLGDHLGNKSRDIALALGKIDTLPLDGEKGSESVMSVARQFGVASGLGSDLSAEQKKQRVKEHLERQQQVSASLLEAHQMGKLNATSPQEIEKQARTVIKQQAHDEAFTAYSRTQIANSAQGYTVGQVASDPKGLEKLTEIANHLNGMSKQLAEREGLPASSALTFKPEDLKAGLIKAAGDNLHQSLTTLFNDERTWRHLVTGIKKGNEVAFKAQQANGIAGNTAIPHTPPTNGSHPAGQDASHTTIQS